MKTFHFNEFQFVIRFFVMLKATSKICQKDKAALFFHYCDTLSFYYTGLLSAIKVFDLKRYKAYHEKIT